MDACVGIQLEHVVLEPIHCKDETCGLLMFVFQAQPLHARGCKPILLMGGQTRKSNEQWGIDIVTAMGSVQVGPHKQVLKKMVYLGVPPGK